MAVRYTVWCVCFGLCNKCKYHFICLMKQIHEFRSKKKKCRKINFKIVSESFSELWCSWLFIDKENLAKKDFIISLKIRSPPRTRVTRPNIIRIPKLTSVLSQCLSSPVTPLVFSLRFFLFFFENFSQLKFMSDFTIRYDQWPHCLYVHFVGSMLCGLCTTVTHIHHIYSHLHDNKSGFFLLSFLHWTPMGINVKRARFSKTHFGFFFFIELNLFLVLHIDKNLLLWLCVYTRLSKALSHQIPKFCEFENY